MPRAAVERCCPVGPRRRRLLSGIRAAGYATAPVRLARSHSAATSAAAAESRIPFINQGAIDLPEGGDVVIRNNVLEKGPNSENAQMIGLALEGPLHEANQTLIEGNLLLFDTVPAGIVQSLGQALGLMPARGTVIHSASPGPVVLRNNTIVGAREIGSGVTEQGNRMYQNRGEAGLPPYPALPEAPR